MVPDLIYHAPLQGGGGRNSMPNCLKDPINADFDDAGPKCHARISGGYTSYSSMDQLHKFSSYILAN